MASPNASRIRLVLTFLQRWLSRVIATLKMIKSCSRHISKHAAVFSGRILARLHALSVALSPIPTMTPRAFNTKAEANTLEREDTETSTHHTLGTFVVGEICASHAPAAIGNPTFTITSADSEDEGSPPSVASTSTAVSPNKPRSFMDGEGDNASLAPPNKISSRPPSIFSIGDSNRLDASLQAVSSRNGSTVLLSSNASCFGEEEAELDHLSENPNFILLPVLPSCSDRYKHGRKIDMKITKPVILSAHEQFNGIRGLPAGWTRHVHSEGLPLFHFKGNMLGDPEFHPGWLEQEIVTEDWIISDSDGESPVLADLIRVVDDIGDLVRSHNLEIPAGSHLCLHLIQEEGSKTICEYYFAHPEKHIVFWLKTCDLSFYMNNISGDLTSTHLELILRKEYWQHCEFYSPIVPMTSKTLTLAADVVRDTRMDVLGSRTPTSTKTSEELARYSEILLDIGHHFYASQGHSKKCDPPSSYPIYTCLRLIYEDRIHDFYGEYNARLDREQSIFYSDKKCDDQSWMFKALSPFLFCAPNNHLKEMNKIWVDRITVLSRWKVYFTDLNVQWGEHIVHSSILLNANVAFLAIPTNDPNNNSDYADMISIRTAQQIASYLSIIASVASMVLALLLVRQHKSRLQNTKQELNDWLCKMDHGVRNLESLSCLYAVPYAALIWGMITFFAAFLCMCFTKASLLTRLVTGFATIPFVSLVIWCLCIGWALYLNEIYNGVRDLLKRGESGDDASSVTESTDSQSLKNSVGECSDTKTAFSEKSGEEKKPQRWSLFARLRRKCSPPEQTPQDQV